MESYDERRRRDEERRHGRQDDSGPHRDTWWRRGREHDDDREERSRFSPDWSREGAEPRYSDLPYYSRNREQESWTLHGPYAGRGPKGYKRSDQQIVEEACQRLERDGHIDASDIEVTAEDRVIRLRGTVQDRQTKRRAEECVESVYGVRDVMNELRVSQQSGRGSSQSSQQGTQASQGPTLGQRPGAGSASSDQLGEDQRPRH